MKNLLFLLGAGLIFFSSCTEVVFTEPQPKNGKTLNEIPKSWSGKYAFVALNNEELLNVQGNYVESDDGKSFLSDSLILRSYKGKYFINKRMKPEGQDKYLWSVQMIEEKGCGFLKVTGFYIGDDEEKAKALEKYPVKEVEAGQSKYLIMGSDPKVFDKMMEDDLVLMSVILEKLE